MPGIASYLSAKRLSLGLWLLTTSLACVEMSHRFEPCKAEQLVGSWAGISERGEGGAILLVLQADGAGHFEISARQKDGAAANLQRRIEKWDIGAMVTSAFATHHLPATEASRHSRPRADASTRGRAPWTPSSGFRTSPMRS